MNISCAARQFSFITGKSADEYSIFLEQTESEILSRLKPEASPDDKRLDTLWGAMAAFRYTEADCAKENRRITAAGSVSAEGNDHRRREAAERIFREAENACADLLADRDFIFAGIKG